MVWLLLVALALPVFRYSNPVVQPEDTPSSHRFAELSSLLHDAGVAYGRHNVRAAREAFNS
ncbi:MAG TPA: hypothetical protein VGM92_12475, partial [Candidatus Kapabacteria bacterium]